MPTLPKRLTKKTVRIMHVAHLYVLVNALLAGLVGAVPVGLVDALLFLLLAVEANLLRLDAAFLGPIL
jgi:hypothetical protein